MTVENNAKNSKLLKVIVLIEPKIRKKWLAKIITLNKLFTISHLRTKLFLKITLRGRDIPSSLSISQLHLHDAKGYCRTFSPIQVRINQCKPTKTDPLIIILPYSGQFWLDANIKSEPANYELQIHQKTLEGNEGMGTISNLIGKENPIKGYSSRMPIGAIDILNIWLIALTIGLFVLTAIFLFCK